MTEDKIEENSSDLVQGEAAGEVNMQSEEKSGAAQDSSNPANSSDNETQEGAPVEVEYSVSGGLVARLTQLGISIVFSSYQSGLLYLLGRDGNGGIAIHQTGLPKPMGLCVDKHGDLYLTAAYQLLRFVNILEPDQQINHTFDACYIPRTVYVTGGLDAHDVGVDNEGRPIFVNTRFNCLATVTPRHSFEMIWKPFFISGLVDEDRCHLNGLAMEDGVAKFVSAVSRSDTIDGWRDRRADGGIVIDVEKNEIICTGLSMPHSPRLYNGELWILNSGTGELGVINIDDKGKGTFEPRVFCPGFLRGLSFHNGYAFVGLSKPRYKRFEGLELDQRLQDADSEPWCGVQIIDIAKGTCVDWFRIDGTIGELYDVEILQGPARPMAVPPESGESANLVTFDQSS